MNTEFTVKKSSVEIYYLRPDGHSCGWADITIDEGEKSGRISISSDFGNWAYYWGACGSGFKNFLTQLDICYAAGKFGEGRYFDVEATIKGVKKDIIDHLRKEYITSEEARDFWDYLPQLEELNDSNSFATLFYNSDLMKMYDMGPDMVEIISPSFQRFWESTWQKFIAELKSESLVAA